MEGQGGGCYVCNYARLVTLDCVHAEGLAWVLSLLYSTRSVNVQSMQVILMNHSLEKVFTNGQLHDVSPGVRARIYIASHKPKTHCGEIYCCQLLVL